MKSLIPILALIAFSLVACDKAKNLINQTKSTVKDQIIAKVGGDKSAKADEAFQKLVDQTPEGVIFRKDLPFPSHLEVIITRRREMSVRFSQTSEIEKRMDVIKGEHTSISQLERTDNQVRYTLKESEFKVPSTDPKAEPKKIADPFTQTPPSTKPVTFAKSGKAWKIGEPADFHSAVLAAQVTPVLDELLIESALVSRSLWFAKRRIKIGYEFDVTGDALSMLLSGNVKGSLHLKLESIDSVNGQPCGVFSVTGNYTRKDFPDFSGNLTDEDVGIQSGKLWLSLIHPVILKEELDTIQTFKSGGNGGLAGRVQGSVKLFVTREWKPIAPATAPTPGG
jgi:hypothetical protein